MTIEQTPTDAIVITGQRAIHFYSMLSLRAALRLYVQAGITTRAFGSKSKMLTQVTKLTGQKYSARSDHDLHRALSDLTTIIDAQEPGQ